MVANRLNNAAWTTASIIWRATAIHFNHLSQIATQQVLMPVVCLQMHIPVEKVACNSSKSACLLGCSRINLSLLVCQVLRLESYCVVSNRTGIPLQLMQWQASDSHQVFDNKAGGGTALRESKQGLPKRKADTPLQPGLKAAIQDPSVDWTSCLDLPVGGSHWIPYHKLFAISLGSGTVTQ